MTRLSRGQIKEIDPIAESEEDTMSAGDGGQGRCGRRDPSNDKRIETRGREIAVSYTHLTLPTKRIV